MSPTLPQTAHSLPALQPRRRAGGFTLLEVLVALAVFALTASALMLQTQRSTATNASLNAHMLGTMLAENTIEQLRSEKNIPVSGSSETVEFGGRSWQLSYDISNTARADMQRLTVSVLEPVAGADYARPVAELSAFLGQH